MARSACSFPSRAAAPAHPARRGRGKGHRRTTIAALWLLCLLAALPPEAESQSQARRISVTWTEAPIRDVLRAFAVFSGVSIVPGADVAGFVTADINDQPWDVALETILSTRGLVATEDQYGIIRVETMESLSSRQIIEPLLTRSYRISYGSAAEIQATIGPLLSDRGSVSVVATTNTLVVTDIARIHRMLGGVLR